MEGPMSRSDCAGSELSLSARASEPFGEPGEGCGHRQLAPSLDGPKLIPADPVEGARAEQWISLVATHFDPVAARPYLAGYFFPGTADGSPDRARIGAAIPKLEAQLPVFDRAVARTGHLVGENFTLADAYLLPLLFYLEKMPESGPMLRKLPSLSGYLDRHLARPSVRATIPPPLPSRPS